MRLTYRATHKSIHADVSTDDLNDFVVLSGRNGSGKTHVLEAIANGFLQVDAVAVSGPPGQSARGIRYFRPGEFTFSSWSAERPSDFSGAWGAVEESVRRVKASWSSRIADPQQLDLTIVNELSQNNFAIRERLRWMAQSAQKPLCEFTTADFQKYAPGLSEAVDPFSTSVTRIFLGYQVRWQENEFWRWQKQSGGPQSGEPLEPEEFKQHHGEPPWDLLNDILQIVGLDYRFKSPLGAPEHQAWEARLIRPDDGLEILPQDLSSGEKTLLTLGLSTYSGTHLSRMAALPQMVLLDEADASLHPSMIESLVRVIKEILQARLGLKVILATHSPTTVALAPEEAIYSMSPGVVRRIEKATRASALAELTAGLPTLSIRVEDCRAVFVESEHDQACYQELFRVGRKWLETERSLEFIASGKKGLGNRDRVIELVASLRAAQNDQVRGIVDNDGKGGSPEAVHFAAGRDALENLVLDPVGMGVFILRQGVEPSEKFDLPENTGHLNLDPDQLERLGRAVLARIHRDGDSDSEAEFEYAGGTKVRLPDFWCMLDGHKLEERYFESIPKLRTRYEKTLKREIVSQCYGDHPGLIPGPLIDLFKSLCL